MPNRQGTRRVSRGRTPLARRLVASASDARRLLAAVALLHVALAVALFAAARARVAPSLVDRDGVMGSFAFDSYEYREGAARLAQVLRREGVAAWARAEEPLHVKLISVEFALLAPLFGEGTLSAEPFNLACYVAVVALTLALGREVGGARAGALAAWAVALLPSLLLHTLQLLKDPLFVAVALALVLCATTWLTRTYAPRGAILTGALAAFAVSLLVVVRPTFAVFIFALALVGFALLVVRQLRERRVLHWNMACPLLVLAASGLLLLHSHAPRRAERLKHFPSDGGGQPKSVAGDGEQVPSVVTYLPRAQDEQTTYAGRLRESADRAAVRIGSVRSRFAALYAGSGSNVDTGVTFRRLGDLLLYLPRAFEIGCCAPFPATWATAGARTGSAGRLLSGAETLFMYATELLALVAVLRPPRRIAAWLLLSVSAFGVTLMALVVPNVGALYRFRYTFWVLLVVLGAKGLDTLVASTGRRLAARTSLEAD